MHCTFYTTAAVMFTLGLANFAFGQGGATSADWVNISDSVVKELTAAGTKLPQYAPTSGVAVDRATGRVFMEITGIGLYASDDHGEHFSPVGQGHISGRCEFGYAMNADPAGSRLACFMLDGKCGMTLDEGKTWTDFAGVGRNWDFGAVDWSDPQAKSMFAIHHESGGEVYMSKNAGKTWDFLGKHPEFHSVGIFNDHTLVAGRDDGIVRSTDSGVTWEKVSDLHPVGRVAIQFNRITYWLAKEGLIKSDDDGATWRTQGDPVKAGWGPLFGKDESYIIVADANSIFVSLQGTPWQRFGPLPPFTAMPPHQPGQFLSIAWDSKNGYLYASRMGNPTYRLDVATRWKR